MKTLANPQARAEIIDRLGHLTHDAPRQWGRMSAHQMVCHLNDAYRMAMAEQPAAPTGGPLDRTLIKWLAFHLPVPWPRDYRGPLEIDQRAGRGTPPGEFARDVATLIQRVELFAAPERTWSWAPHPIFGPLTEWQWMRWGYLHGDHHLRQFGV